MSEPTVDVDDMLAAYARLCVTPERSDDPQRWRQVVTRRNLEVELRRAGVDPDRIHRRVEEERRRVRSEWEARLGDDR